MAFFVVTGVVQLAQVLNAGQAGVVAEGATLFVNAGAAIFMNGSSQLAVMGNVTSQAQQAVSIVAATEDAFITVAQSGSLIGLVEAGIRGTLIDQFHLSNAGLIMGVEQGVDLEATGANADFHIANTGRIQSNGDAVTEHTVRLVTVSGGRVDLANSGTILNGGLGGAVVVTGAALDLTNSGTIQCRPQSQAILSGAGLDTIINTGTIIGAVSTLDGNDTLTNSGTLTGAVTMGNGSDRLTNSGTITGPVNLTDVATTGAIADTVINTGLIVGDISLGNGNDTFHSRGGTVEGTVYGGIGDDDYYVDDGDLLLVESSGQDQVFASVDFALASGFEELHLRGPAGLRGTGSVDANVMSGAAGDDTLSGALGNDSLTGNGGDDVLYGGEGNDDLTAVAGSDLLKGGLGDDILRIGSGDAVLDGGRGTDTLSLAFGATGAAVNLAAGTGEYGLAGAWTIEGIENVEGGLGADTLTGNGGANLIAGNDGDDRILGGGGGDTLVGGAGADTMNGGAGSDVFVFRSLADSAAGATDLIEGFSLAADIIDLSAIEAVLGDDASAFVFLGTGAFTGGAAGEVRFSTSGGSTLIEVRQAGSATNDMVIVLTGEFALTADSFAL